MMGRRFPNSVWIRTWTVFREKSPRNAVTRAGELLYQHAAGCQFLAEDLTPLDPDSTISCTSAGKFITNIAALQLVKWSISMLDEPISLCLPEIEKCLFVEDGGKGIRLWPPSRAITLRHLLLTTNSMHRRTSF
ncbi:hypothetical protein NLU13_5657 [Sarocladium strictum]|uniref:Uncharacterized protein n=1 Tax=Sarocladium strictum TaxID=5046 RepID=A0AA39GI33_SARSR|nr:hypothetical protein NLU13_5657 [Sarocladium strictum]